MRLRILTNVLLVGLTLAACGGTAAPQSPPASSSGASAPASAGSSTAAAPASAAAASPASQAGGKTVEISLHYPQAGAGPLAKIIDGYAAEFSKANPDIKVTPVYDGDYPTTLAKVQQLVQAGTPPDVAIVNSAAIYTMIDSDIAIPLDDFIAKSGGDSLTKDFFPAFMANSQQLGHVYSLPFQRSTLVMYYNKDAFKEAGISDAPQSWQDVIADAQKLTKKDASGKVTRWGVGFPSSGTAYWEFQALAIENGQNVFDNNSGNKVFFNSQASVDGLQLLIDLNKKYNVSPTGTVNWDTLPSDFAAGNYGIMFHTTGSLTNVLNSSKFEVGVGFMPKSKQFGTPTGGGGLYLVKGTSPERQAASWKLIQFLTSPDRQAQWSIDSGYVASRISAYDTPTLKDYVAKRPQALVARDQLQYAQNELGTHQMAQVQQILSNAVQAGVTGQSDPKAALDKAQQDTEKLLSQFKN
ncbi:MAG: ABC transporter substrate-binding protein [Chloroflexi bacterium]|nr:ABC transporter substrate-binding protein [Chloroflexota bacterium]